MFNSPLVMDQRSCPSFLSPREDHRALSLSTAQESLPLSLEGIATMVQGGARGRVNIFSPTSTAPPSQQRTRSSRGMYEMFMLRDAIVRERKEKAREAALREEMSECRAVPRISAMGHNIQRDSDIVDRFERVHREKQKLNAFKQAERERDQQQSMEGWFAPTITSLGRHTEGRAVHLAENVQRKEGMEKERECQLLSASLRQHRQSEDFEELRNSPMINPHSSELVQRARKRDGLLGGMSHLETMIERDRMAKLVTWERQQLRILQDVTPFTPRITAYAATLRRNGNVVERLTAASPRREQPTSPSTRKAVKERSVTDDRGSFCANVSPRRSCQKQKQYRGQQRQHHFLLLSMDERQRQYNLRREEKIRSIVEKERLLQTPTINPVSEAIAASLPVSSTERLTTGRTKRDNKSLEWGNEKNIITPNRFSTGLGAEEYMSRNQTPMKRGIKAATITGGRRGLGGGSAAAASSPSVSLSRGKGDVYERMCHWKKLRDERVQRLRSELQEETKRLQEELQADEGIQDARYLKCSRSVKRAPDGHTTPRRFAEDMVPANPPVVLSLGRVCTDPT